MHALGDEAMTWAGDTQPSIIEGCEMFLIPRGNSLQDASTNTQSTLALKAPMLCLQAVKSRGQTSSHSPPVQV